VVGVTALVSPARCALVLAASAAMGACVDHPPPSAHSAAVVDGADTEVDGDADGGGGVDAAACKQPPPFDATQSGCRPIPTAKLCNPSSEICQPECDTAHYELVCSNPMSNGLPYEDADYSDPVLVPDSSLGCVWLGIPGTASFYCCPCAR
jgi:hypothetical protein